jgi:rod shape-determining protein MreB
MRSTKRPLRPALAIDAGTATFRVACPSHPAICETPAALAGRSALRGGVVEDPDCGAAVLRPLLARARGRRLLRPRVVASAPSDADPGEREVLADMLRRAGAHAVTIVDELLAAAVGSGIDVGSPYARMVVDIGYGATDCVVIRSGSILASEARRVGCADLEDATRRHVAAAYGVLVTRPVAAELLLALRFGERPHGDGFATVGSHEGRHGLRVELPRLAEALARTYRSIVSAPVELCRKVGADVGAELVENGIHVTGGGSLLPGIVEAMASRTRLLARRVPDPLGAVVRGNRAMIATIDRLDAWE